MQFRACDVEGAPVRLLGLLAVLVLARLLLVCFWKSKIDVYATDAAPTP